MTRKRRTEEELREATNHIHYEISMLYSLAGGLASGIAGQGNTLHNALLESFIVHGRALIDFLYPPNKPKNDAVIAADFFNTQEEWEKLRPGQSEILKKAKKRAHKEVAHLTYDRQKVTLEEKGWNFLEISHEIQEVIKIFLENINKNILGSRWKESIP
jgi:hypothetical protein